jgi:hypothetical protein
MRVSKNKRGGNKEGKEGKGEATNAQKRTSNLLRQSPDRFAAETLLFR